MKKDVTLRGWFKSYCDRLHLMYKRLTTDEAPRILEVESEFVGNFNKQAKIEEEKLDVIFIER